MKNTCLAFLSWALVATAVFSPIHVKAFGPHALSSFGNTRSNFPVTASRMPTGHCRPSTLRTTFIEEADEIDIGVKHEASSRKYFNFAIRSAMASAFALVLVTSSSVEMAAAESSEPSTSVVQTSTPAGNAVLGAWIGISGFAGIKGIYERIQQEQKEK